MIKSAYKMRTVLNAMARSIPKMWDQIITKAYCEQAKKFCDSLESAPSITEHQSESTYVTLRLDAMDFKFFIKRFEKAIGDSDSTLMAIAAKMLLNWRSMKVWCAQN